MLQTVSEGATEIVDYDYLGRTRVAERAYQNDMLTTAFGYDFRGRVDSMSHSTGSGVFDDRKQPGTATCF